MKPKPPKCKICAAPNRNAINQRIVRGDSIASIAKDFGCCYKTMARHAGIGTGKDGLPLKPHYAKQVTDVRKRMDNKAGLDLLACAEEIYLDCKDSAKKAKEKAEATEGKARDFREAMGCWDNATKALGLLKTDDKPQVNQTTTINNYDNLSKEELRELVRLTEKSEGMETDLGKEKPD